MEGGQNGLFCSICQVSSFNEVSHWEHLEGKRHRRRVAAQGESRHCALCDVHFTNYERHKGGKKHQKLLRAQEGWAGDTVKPAPGHDPGHDPGLDESEQMPEEEEQVVTRPPVGSLDVPISEKAAMGQKTQSFDMLELARQSYLSSSQIRAAGEEEKELEKRVRGIRLKVNQKRDSVIMLRNVLKMKKDEVSELKKTFTIIEPVPSTSSTKISRSSSWGVKRSVPYQEGIVVEDNMASTKTNMLKSIEIPSGRVAPSRCSSCHKPGHFARDCEARVSAPEPSLLRTMASEDNWDDYHSSYTLIGTSKAAITVNPDTPKAAALVRHAQLADFSPFSRLDQFVASAPLSSFNRVVNVVGVQDMQENVVAASESLVPVVVYGFLTQLDLDSDDAISLRCGRCGGPMVSNEDGEVCSSFDCKDFNVCGPERMLPSQQFKLRVDVSDETGTLSGLRVSSAFLSKNLGSVAEFARLSGETKTAFKRRWFLKPLKLSLALLLPTAPHISSTGMLVDAAEVSLQEIAAKIPAPSL